MDDSGGGDAGEPDAGDADTAPSRGCAPATSMTRLLCEDFSGTTIAPQWIQGINATGHLALVDDPAVSSPGALRSDVKGFPSGDDARLFRNFPGPFTRARVTFDVQIDTNAGFYFALALGDCAFLVGTNADGVIGHVKNGATSEESDAAIGDRELLKSSVWRRVTIDATNTTGHLTVEGAPQDAMDIVSPTACGTGDASLSLGIYGQRGYALVYFDNVSLDVE